MWASSPRETDTERTMPRPSLDRIAGVATADAVRNLMPTFDLAEALAQIEALIVTAARVGRTQVDVMGVLPKHNGILTAAFIRDCREQVTTALASAGYDFLYEPGGHAGGATLDVSWGKK